MKILSILLFIVISTGMLVHSYLHGADFHVFYLAGQRVLNGISPYQVSDGWMVFKYHPFWGLVFSAWTLLPEKTSLIIFNSTQIFCWIWAAYIWAKELGFQITSWAQVLLLLILSLTALSAEIGYGQINGFAFLLATLIFSLLNKPNPNYIWSGIFLCMLVSLKLNFALLVIYAVFRNVRTLWGILLGGLFIHGAVALMAKDLWAANFYAQWLDLLLGQSSSQYSIFEAQGFLRFFISLSDVWGKSMWAATIAIFCLFGIWLQTRHEMNQKFIPIYWITGVYLFSPLAWWYQVLFAFPLIFFLLHTKLSKLQRYSINTCLFVFAIVSYNTLGPQGIYLFKQYQGYFIILLIPLGIAGYKLIHWLRKNQKPLVFNSTF